MDGGFFRCELFAEAKTAGRSAEIYDQGDPGNRATVKMLCEATLALALNGDELPGGAGFGGVLTPASGIGLILRDRLAARGMSFRISTPITEGHPGIDKETR